MGALLKFLGLIASVFYWLHDKGQRTLGRGEQRNDDDQLTIKKLKAEQDALAARPSAVDELHDGKF